MSDTWNLKKMLVICLFFVFCLVVSIASFQSNFSFLNETNDNNATQNN